MVFITQFFKSIRFDIVVRWLVVLCLCIFLGQIGSPASAAELTQLRVERADDGVYLSAVVQFDLTPVVEDALMKGIAMFFVVEADVYQSRWYWTDRRASSATRTIRLAFQPLTRRWRVNIAAGLINSSSGLRATLNQNYDTLAEALSAVQRVSRWKIADNNEIDSDVMYKLEFSFNLDLSQLPRPFQIGVAGQKEWTISVQQNERLQLGAARPAAGAIDRPKTTGTATVPAMKEADK